MHSADGLSYLEQQLGVFESLRQNVTLLENHILNSSGCGKEYELMKTVAKPVSHTVHCLEDIWCAFAEGRDELQKVYDNNGLLYQTLRPNP